MRNQYELKSVRVTRVVSENETTRTLFFELGDQWSFEFLSGQFMMIGLPGFGECPISI